MHDLTPFNFIILSLATFRLSLLVSQEDGPAWIFAKLRRVPPPRSSARKGLSCPWCVSMWFGGFVACYAYFCAKAGHSYPPADFFLLGLALSAVSIIINQLATPSK